MNEDHLLHPTDPEFHAWWLVKCCEAGQVAYPAPCPWHGEQHPEADPVQEAE